MDTKRHTKRATLLDTGMMGAAAAVAALAHADCSAMEASVAAHYGHNPVNEDGIPDHVSLDTDSPFFWRHYRTLGVKIDGEVRKGDVHEFCVSEGWAMVRSRNDIGQFRIDPNNTRRFLTERVRGKIEPYLKHALPVEKVAGAVDGARLDAAAAKRARKAAKLAAQHG